MLINTITHVVKSSSYAEYSVDSNTKKAKLKIGDQVRITKYKNIFAKGYAPNWSGQVFVISKVKNTVPCTLYHLAIHGGL